MRVIIAGSRHYSPAEADRLVHKAMLAFIDRERKDVELVISGTAGGIDQAGERWAAKHGKPVERYPADWKSHGRAAGPLRNRKMASVATHLVFVWDGVSDGTWSMLQEARLAGLDVFGIKGPAKESA